MLTEIKDAGGARRESMYAILSQSTSLEVTMFKHLLIPIDGSEGASRAMREAMALARDMQAKVTVFIATEPFRMLSAEAEQVERVQEEYDQYQRDRAKGFLESAKELARQSGVPCDTAQAEHDRPYEAIIDAAKRAGCDVIAMGSHGYGGVKGLVLGSVTQKVLTHCAIPVLVYR